MFEFTLILRTAQGNDVIYTIDDTSEASAHAQAQAEYPDCYVVRVISRKLDTGNAWHSIV